MTIRFDEFTLMKKPMKVQEIEFPIHIGNGGTFLIQLGEHDWVGAETYRELRNKLCKYLALQKKTINIPFCQLNNRDGIRKGIIRGIHASNGRFLITWDDGKNDFIGKVYSTFYEIPDKEIESKVNTLAKRSIL